MWVLMPVTDGKAYIFPEVLGNMLQYRGEKHFHFVFDSAPKAAALWEDWRQALPPRLTTTAEFTEGGPPFGHNYNMRIVTWIMRLDERLRCAFLASGDAVALFQECDQPMLPCQPDRLAERDVDIVSAATPARVMPDCLMAMTKEKRMLRAKLPSGELVEVGSVGLGCTVVKRRVLETVSWDDPEALVAKHKNGADTVLCREYASRTGIYPYVDCSVCVDHVDLRDGQIVRHRVSNTGKYLEVGTS